MKRTLVLMVLLIIGSSSSAHSEGDMPISPILMLQNDTATAVAWSPDGTQLAVGDATGIHLYTQDLQFVRFMEQPSEQMKNLQWNPNGTYIAAYGANDVGRFNPSEPRQTTVYIWNAESGELITAFNPYRFYVEGLAWNPDGSRIATGGWDEIIHIWNPLTGEIEYTLDAPQAPSNNYANEVQSLSWSADGQLAAVIGAVGTFIWDDFTHEPREIIEHQAHPPYPYTVIWSPNAEFISLGIGIYDLGKDQRVDFKNCPGAGVWSPNGKSTAIYTRDGVFVCDPFNDTIVSILRGSVVYPDGVVLSYQDSLDWSPDGTRLAGAAGDGYVRIWDISDLTKTETTPES